MPSSPETQPLKEALLSTSSESIPEVAKRVLHQVVAALPGAEIRPAQEEMVSVVAEALATGSHAVLEVGTGVGKSLSYLIPAFLAVSAPEASDLHVSRVVVATATKALQDQIAAKDAPFLEEALGPLGAGAKVSVLKGRSSYLCRARLSEMLTSPTLEQLDLETVVEWSETSETGDRDELPEAVPDEDWSKLSVSSAECPGASSCPFGAVCFAEYARRRAASADVVVTNTAMYAAHLASGELVLPEHDAVVFDEAHVLEDVVADAFGVSLSAPRLFRLASRATGVPSEPLLRLRDAALALGAFLDMTEGRVDTTEGELATLLSTAASAVDSVGSAVVSALSVDSLTESVRTRLQQAAKLAETLATDLASLMTGSYPEVVSWVEGSTLRSSPVEVDSLLQALFASKTVVATSATLTYARRFDLLAHRWGLPLEGDGSPKGWMARSLGSPFDYQRNSYLWLPQMPDPRHETYPERVAQEVDRLARAANGRTLVLFTSYAALQDAAERLRALSPPYEVLVQGQEPRPVLLSKLGRGSVLLATSSFWTGVDVPGLDLTCVVIPRLPFPRPDDPLQQARREAATRRRTSWFAEVDLPYAAKLLAQGAGRLVRSGSDRGVVAILDSRVSRARYGEHLLESLPPFRRVSSEQQVLGALSWLDSQDPPTE